jgi:hypothetical protein
MNSRRCFSLAAVSGLAALMWPTVSAAAPEKPPETEAIQVLAQGPVHEAYAQPVNTQADPATIVTKPPPDAIEELPPDQRPEGDRVQWIPGYWAWDEDQSDYLWVSGSWRMPPPGRRWLPGHWQEVDTGWVWVAGFWAPEKVNELQYLPPPPPTLDDGPSSPAPDESSTYVPGCWVHQETRFLWRPGHWIAYVPCWVWTPACYTWTPSGCLFNDGYWDHPLDERGLLFAPVRFGKAWWSDRRAFTPQYVIHQDFLLGALFVGPARQHYYFGDYFEPVYEKRGFVAWTDDRKGRNTYDPMFGYYHHQHAADPSWERGLRELYRARQSGDVPRPPRTLLQQIETVKKLADAKTTDVVVHKNINLTHVQNVTALAPLKEIHNTKVTNLGSLSQAQTSKVPPRDVRIEKVTQDDHTRQQKVAEQARQLAQQRRENEAKILGQGGAPLKHTDPPKVVKVELPPPPPHVTPPRPVQKVAPPPPVIPKHEERPIPKFEPKPPPGPPKGK